MPTTTERRPTTRTLRGWAISMLDEAGAIHECEEHGRMQDRTDPHTRERAVEAARQRFLGRTQARRSDRVERIASRQSGVLR